MLFAQLVEPAEWLIVAGVAEIRASFPERGLRVRLGGHIRGMGVIRPSGGWPDSKSATDMPYRELVSHHLLWQSRKAACHELFSGYLLSPYR